MSLPEASCLVWGWDRRKTMTCGPETVILRWESWFGCKGPRERRASAQHWTVSGWGLARFWGDWVRLCTGSSCRPEERKLPYIWIGWLPTRAWPPLKDRRVGHKGSRTWLWLASNATLMNRLFCTTFHKLNFFPFLQIPPPSLIYLPLHWQVLLKNLRPPANLRDFVEGGVVLRTGGYVMCRSLCDTVVNQMWNVWEVWDNI